MRCQLQRQRLGHLHQPGLGNGVGQHPLADAKAKHRGDVDDNAAGFRRRHALRRLLGHGPSALQVGVQNPVPVVLRQFQRRLAAGDAGVVDDHRHRAGLFLDGLERLGDAGGVGDVHFDADGLAAP